MNYLMSYNVLSFLLGLAAWALPLICLKVGRRRDIFCCASFALCGLALYFQLREILRRVNLRDFSAIDDTLGAVVFAATVLLAVTLALNAIPLLRKER